MPASTGFPLLRLGHLGIQDQHHLDTVGHSCV
jgi:hypothetical protein